MALQPVSPFPEGVGVGGITTPVTPGQQDPLTNLSSAQNQQLALQNMISGMNKRQREALWGRIPGMPGSEQGAEISDLVNANRPEAQANQAADSAVRAGGGWGIVKEPGLLGQLLRMADAAAKQRQTASVEQLRLARLPLQDLRKYVDEAVPEQIVQLMTGYKSLGGEMRQLLEENLQKLSQEGGRIGNVARAAVKGDIGELSRALDVPKGEIQAAVSQATGAVVPGVEQRGEVLGEGYKAASVQEIMAQSESKGEAMDLVKDLYGGQKEEINKRFDQLIEKAEATAMQRATSAGLDRTTAKMVASGEVNRLRAQQQSALNQVGDMAAKAKVQASNLWEQGKASARQMFATGRLGAQQATGGLIGQIAGNLASQGLQGTMGLMGQKMAGIGGGYRGLMDLTRQIAGQEFGAQTAGRQQLADAIRGIGQQGLSAQQQADQSRAGQVANVTQAQSGLEERVEHQGMDPRLWMGLAQTIGGMSQLGPAGAGAMLPGMAGGQQPFWGQFPGQPPQPPAQPPAQNPAQNVINVINRMNQQVGGSVPAQAAISTTRPAISTMIPAGGSYGPDFVSGATIATILRDLGVIAGDAPTPSGGTGPTPTAPPTHPVIDPSGGIVHGSIDDPYGVGPISYPIDPVVADPSGVPVGPAIDPKTGGTYYPTAPAPDPDPWGDPMGGTSPTSDPLADPTMLADPGGAIGAIGAPGLPGPPGGGGGGGGGGINAVNQAAQLPVQPLGNVPPPAAVAPAVAPPAAAAPAVPAPVAPAPVIPQRPVAPAPVIPQPAPAPVVPPNLPGSQAAIDSAIAGTPPAFDAPSQYGDGSRPGSVLPPAPAVPQVPQAPVAPPVSYPSSWGIPSGTTLTEAQRRDFEGVGSMQGDNPGWYYEMLRKQLS